MKIYDNISQWYFPEIDYWKMLDNFSAVYSFSRKEV